MNSNSGHESSETFEDLAISFLLSVLRRSSEMAVLPQPLDVSVLSDEERAVVDLLLARAARRACAVVTNSDLPLPHAAGPDDVTQMPSLADEPVKPVVSGVTTSKGPLPKPRSWELDTQAATTCQDKENEMIYGPRGIPKVGSDPKAAPQRMSLKNGRTREPYQGQIEGFDQLFLKDDGGSRLNVSPKGEVTGEDLAAGDYTLVLAASKEGVAQPELHARVSVIADPRDLWTSLPSDQTTPFAKPDEAFAKIDAPAVLVAASKRGRSHAKDGGYRDDHFVIRFDEPTGWHTLIVADGAGSAPLSREGSRVASETAMTNVQKYLEENATDIEVALEGGDASIETRLARIFYNILPRAALDAAEAVSGHAGELQRPATDFATTLVILVSRRYGAGWVSASFTVGDGGVAIWDEATSEVRVMCRPDSGEFAGQTRFLSTSEFKNPSDLEARLFVDVRERFTAAFALTDGITDPKFPTDAVFADPETWAVFWREDFGSIDLASPTLDADLMEWLDFWSRGNHDDRTVAAMILEPKSFEEFAAKEQDCGVTKLGVPEAQAISAKHEAASAEVLVGSQEDQLPSEGGPREGTGEQGGETPGKADR